MADGELVTRWVITWQNPKTGEAFYYHPNGGTLWTTDAAEARVFRTRAEAEASFHWLSRLVRPKIETIRFRVKFLPATGG